MRPLHALVVCECRAERDAIQQVLAHAGYVVEAAADARGALTCAEKQPPDVVVVDWTLRGMPSCELLQKLRSFQPNEYAFAVAISDRASGVDVASALGAGFDDFARKPLAFEELVARVNGARRLRRLVSRLSKLPAFDGLQMTKLDAWMRLERLVADDLGSMLGHAKVAVRGEGAVEEARMAAEITLSLPSEELEIGIAVALDQASIKRIAAILLGPDTPEDAFADVTREIANLAAGSFKRAAVREGVTLTTGLPKDADPAHLGERAARVTRRWCATVDDPAVLVGFQAELRDRGNDLVAVADLREGMVLARDLMSPTGVLIASAGTRLTDAYVQRVAGFFAPRHRIEVADAA